jgi:hypothetical protein
MKRLENLKLRAEIRKLAAESNHLMATTRWYPLVVAAGLFGAIATLVKFFF